MTPEPSAMNFCSGRHHYRPGHPGRTESSGTETFLAERRIITEELLEITRHTGVLTVVLPSTLMLTTEGITFRASVQGLASAGLSLLKKSQRRCRERR